MSERLFLSYYEFMQAFHTGGKAVARLIAEKWDLSPPRELSESQWRFYRASLPLAAEMRQADPDIGRQDRMAV